MRHHSVRKWKDVMRFEIRYFFLDLKKKVSNFKLHYILPLLNGMVAHALTYWTNVGPFGPSLPQPPNLTSKEVTIY